MRSYVRVTYAVDVCPGSVDSACAAHPSLVRYLALLVTTSQRTQTVSHERTSMCVMCHIRLGVRTHAHAHPSLPPSHAGRQRGRQVRQVAARSRIEGDTGNTGMVGGMRAWRVVGSNTNTVRGASTF